MRIFHHKLPAVISVFLALTPLFSGAAIAGNPAAFNTGNNAGFAMDTPSIIATLTTGLNPSHLLYDPGNGYIYVSNAGSGNVSIVKGTSIAGSVAVGPIPGKASYDASNGYVYVPDSDNSALGVSNISVIDGTKLATTIFEGNYYNHFGMNPIYSVYDSSDRYVYVTPGYSSSGPATSSFDVISGTSIVQAVPAVAGVLSSAYASLLYDGVNGYVYSMPFSSNSAVSAEVYSGLTYLGPVNFPVNYGQDYPDYGICDTSNGDVYLWGTLMGGIISVISQTKVVSTVRIPSGDGVNTMYGAFDPSNGYAYVTTDAVDTPQNAVVMIISGTSVIGTVGAGKQGEQVIYDSSDGNVYAVSSNGTLIGIHGTQVVSQTAIPASDPVSLAFDPSNGYIYLANSAASSLYVISTGSSPGPGPNNGPVSSSVTGFVVVGIILAALIAMVVYFPATRRMAASGVRYSARKAAGFMSSVRGPGKPRQEDGADRMTRLKALLDSGAITQAEFDGEKAKILGKTNGPESRGGTQP